MYCASCGTEIDDDARFCSSCGHEIGTPPTEDTHERSHPTPESESDAGATVEGVDYDIVMSIEDGLRRRTPLRLVLDVIALMVTVGFWGGWLLMEFIQHHYRLKKGKVKPWEEGDEKTFNIL